MNLQSKDFTFSKKIIFKNNNLLIIRILNEKFKKSEIAKKRKDRILRKHYQIVNKLH